MERANFCLYYSGSITADQANQAADTVEDYWDRYVADFGFLTPSFSDKLQIKLTVDNDCNGGTSSTSNVMDAWTGCFAEDEAIQKVLGHELFHRVQYSYDGSEVKWFKEGTARAMEDLAFDNIDNWPNALDAVSSSFNKQVNTYLADPNNDITSNGMRYNSALWWKYFTEQFGTVPTEPELGVDALVALWEAAASSDDLAALNAALGGLSPGMTFDQAFRRFATANWTKDLDGVPDASYNYLDEDQAGNPAPYGPIEPANGGTINLATAATWNNQGLSRYGIRYYEVTPAADCPLVSVHFHRDSGSSEFYQVIAQKGSNFATHVEGSGEDWTQSFINDGITKVVVIAGAESSSAQIDLTCSCANPVLSIQLPNNAATSFVGPAATPGKFLVQVLVTNGDPKGPVVAGLSNSDFKVEVNGVPALVTAGGFIQEQYWLVVQAPAQTADGTFDLEVFLEMPGTTDVIATDTNAASVVYDNEETDYVLVIDRSGSMADDEKMTAAINAASFYVDITRNDDGVAVVPYHHDVSPAPFGMDVVDALVKEDAKTFIGGLNPGGATSIGDGLAEALNRLAGSPTGNPRGSIVLLSDGMENSGQFYADVRADLVASDYPVTTIAFGAESNETLLQDIATDTGGLFFFNDVFVSLPATPAGLSSEDEMELDLGDIYEYAQAQAEDRQRLLRVRGLLPIRPEAPDEYKLIVDETVREAVFALDWAQRNVEMRMELVDPDGIVIDDGKLPYSFADFRRGHLGWRLAKPKPGTWGVRVTHQGGAKDPVPYQVLVSGRTSLTLHLLLPDRLGSRFMTGDPVPLLALLSSNRPLNAQVEAVVTGPDGSETRVRLHDDGQHHDDQAGDGLYTGVFTRVTRAEVVNSQEEGQQGTKPNDEGGYRVRVVATHEKFQREALGSFSVLEGADADRNGLPDSYERRHNIKDPKSDDDLDRLTALDEYRVGTDPNNSDTDSGGEHDGSELEHGQDPLAPDDDQIVAPSFFTAAPGVKEVQLHYDVRKEYSQIAVYRSLSSTGPWILRQAELPLNGWYADPAQNGTPYFYRLTAVDRKEHWTAVIGSEPVTPSDDPLPPESQILINRGARFTMDPEVSLSFIPYDEEGKEQLAAFQDISEVILSNEPHFGSAKWQALKQNLAWQLNPETPAGTFAKVYGRFKDSSGNESVGTEVAMILYRPPALTLHIRMVPQGAELSWECIGGVGRYVLEYSPTLGPRAKWQALSEEMDCSGEKGLSFIDSTVPSRNPRFYRLRLVQ
ncbi:MAG: VWA domain-containing protein [Verrucomicrobiales bacterium]|nr:VWA domain-containing protein [Verrucomicrobiales bacterium]